MYTRLQGYVVLNRPYAFQQWVRDHLSKIPEQYILMAEPDHLFVKPPPLLASPTKAAAFPFFYIEPQAKENGDIIQKYNDKDVPLEKFAPIGERVSSQF
jgi:hydroxyproline O-arabinosyltransferase